MSRGISDNDLLLISIVCIYMASKMIDIYSIGMDIIYRDVNYRKLIS